MASTCSHLEPYILSWQVGCIVIGQPCRTPWGPLRDACSRIVRPGIAGVANFQLEGIRCVMCRGSSLPACVFRGSLQFPVRQFVSMRVHPLWRSSISRMHHVLMPTLLSPCFLKVSPRLRGVASIRVCEAMVPASLMRGKGVA